VTNDISGEDYTALLMGDVGGDWTASTSHAGRPVHAAGPQRNTVIALPHLATQAGKNVVVPVNAQGIAGKDIIAYEMVLRYDPAVIQPQIRPVDLAGTASRNLTVAVNATQPGILRIAVYGAASVEENGLLMNLRFIAVGAAGSTSPITWEELLLNDGTPQAMVADGLVTLFE